MQTLLPTRLVTTSKARDKDMISHQGQISTQTIPKIGIPKEEVDDQVEEEADQEALVMCVKFVEKWVILQLIVIFVLTTTTWVLHQTRTRITINTPPFLLH